MPQTIVIPTQAQLAAMQNDPGSLLAMYQAAHAVKPAAGSAAATNAAGVAPGSTTYSPTVVTPVATPTPIATPQINYTPQNNNEWIKATTDMVNQLNQQAQQAANAGRIPGARGLESKSSANINSALSGLLPSDVINQIGQRAAERGVSTGNPYGAGTNADYLRAIGLNSLQLQNTGQDWLTAALARNPAAPIYDASKLLITPTQATGFNLDQANFQLNQQRNQTEIANANAQRQLQSDLANAQNQLERDRLIWQYQQNQLNRDNALRIAQMETAARAAGYGRNAGGGGSSPYGGFNPATNWTGGGTNTFTTPWNLPYNAGQSSLNTVQPGLNYGGEFDTVQPGSNYDAYSPPAGTYYNPTTNTSDYSPLGNYYGGGIDQGGMSQDELDWLYNVGG